MTVRDVIKLDTTVVTSKISNYSNSAARAMTDNLSTSGIKNSMLPLTLKWYCNAFPLSMQSKYYVGIVIDLKN